MVIEVYTPLPMSLFVLRAEALAGNERSSAWPLTTRPVGAAPPDQLKRLLQLALPPLPVQVKVEGVVRASSSSTRRLGNGRKSDARRTDQPLQRRPREGLNISGLR